MLQGLNHLTLATGDLARSIDFYIKVLGFKPHARWDQGAYLSLGDLWLCLSCDQVDSKQDYTHYAFSVAAANFASVADKLRLSGVVEWKINRSEGDSLYFLDPDGHRLEIHSGDLQSRLAECRNKPYQGMQFY